MKATASWLVLYNRSIEIANAANKIQYKWFWVYSFLLTYLWSSAKLLQDSTSLGGLLFWYFCCREGLRPWNSIVKQSNMTLKLGKMRCSTKNHCSASRIIYFTIYLHKTCKLGFVFYLASLHSRIVQISQQAIILKQVKYSSKRYRKNLPLVKFSFLRVYFGYFVEIQ